MDIVIIGGGYAGIACATRLARLAGEQRSAARIRLINPTPVLVERIRLHQAATGQRLRDRRIDTLLARAGIELVSGWVERIDLDGQTVQVGPDRLHWHRLVLALGSHAGSPDVPGAAAHAFRLEADQIAQLHEQLRALPAGARVAVVGGGLTGIEAASEIALAFPHLQVHLVSRDPIAGGFSEPARRYLIEALTQRFDITVHDRVDVRAVRSAALETALQPIAFDVCVWAAGLRIPSLPREAGVRVNVRGQVLVDPALRSLSHPAIYAAGDIAAPVVAPGQHLPTGCKSALPAGAHAGENLARELRGAEPAAFDYALSFFCVSLGRGDGLIQWPDSEGRLTGRILTGAGAALFKETICRMTWWALLWESFGHRGVVWKTTGCAPQRLPETMPS